MKRLDPRNYVGITANNVCRNDLEIAENLGISLAKDLIDLGALSIINEAKTYNHQLEGEIRKNMNEANKSSGGSTKELPRYWTTLLYIF